MKIRQSVPTKGLAEKYLTGSWRYVMPDFDRPDHSIIESTFEYSSRVPSDQTKGREDERAASGA
jgi:hypothetical protein